MGGVADVYFSLGSNLGKREINLENALLELGEIGQIIQRSSIYETSAWGNAELNDFLNMAIRFKSRSSASELLKKIKMIESKMGRNLSKISTNRQSNYQNRLIDIDILYYGDKVIDNEALSVPHPRLHLRRFVLEPLREIAPKYIHPLLKKSTDELLEDCPDLNKVKLHS